MNSHFAIDVTLVRVTFVTWTFNGSDLPQSDNKSRKTL